MTTKNQHIDVDAVAKLSRIQLTKEEKERFREQLEEVLGYIDRLQAIDVDGVEASAHAFEIVNVWDRDMVEASFTQDEALYNASHQEMGQIRVPRIIDDAS
jgi:aspartyl-tRNA(Asn)/glutamyl-tRNA(Gln) amidotransferase subunit C